MAFKTPTEWAEIYETAITSLVAGMTSSYSIAGRSFTRLDLDLLHKLYDYWRSRAEETTWGNVTLADMRSNSGGGL